MSDKRKSNEATFREFILETGKTTLHSGWVVWMLDQIEDFNRTESRVNPEWLRAKWRILRADGVRDDEPPMSL